MNRFEKKNGVLIKAFGQYLRAHSDRMDELPDDALLVMQVEGDETFNAWSRRIAEPDPGQRVVYVKFTLKKETTGASRSADIEELELQPVT